MPALLPNAPLPTAPLLWPDRLANALHQPAIRRGAALLGVLVLAGCGGGGTDDAFAPPCPRPSIPRDFSDLHRYKGAGRDITDSVLEGRITGVDGACKRDGNAVVAVTVSVALELARGPAATSRVADVAYFVAVSEGEGRILDKQSFRLKAEFAPNADRVRLAGDEVELRLPVTAQKSAATYRISVGFELTPVELEANRRGR